jgi:predicted acyl esterase
VSLFGDFQPEPPRYRGMSRSSFYIPMNDGVKLALTLALPKDLPATGAITSFTRRWAGGSTPSK